MTPSKNIKALLRICPVCVSKEGEILHTQKFILPENSPLPSEYDIVACVKCGFTYADTAVGQSGYDNYYTLCSKYEDKEISTGGGYNSYDLQRMEETANDIASFCENRQAKIIDIGCANGGLLKALKAKGYNNLTGLDPSKKCMEDVLNAGVDCKQGSIFEVNKKFLGQKFDFIILSHVAEHIYDLTSAFQACYQLLEKNGRLYVEVPNAAFYHDFYVVPYYYFDSEHINHFDENSLSNLGLSNKFSKTDARHKSIFVSDGQQYPALFVIFEKASNTQSNYTYSREAKESICKYIALSVANSKNEQLKEIVNSQEEIYVFGAGNFTLRLLATTDLNRCNIKAFIDNDSNKQGHILENKPIVSPEVLLDFNGTLIICSALFADDIAKQAKSINSKLNMIILK